MVGIDNKNATDRTLALDNGNLVKQKFDNHDSLSCNYCKKARHLGTDLLLYRIDKSRHDKPIS